MFIKLAQIEGSEDGNTISGVGNAILSCCEQCGVDYISLSYTQFGLITSSFGMAYGRDDFISVPALNLKAFINVCECATQLGVCYTGLRLDNTFFRNVFMFCKEYTIYVEGIEGISQYGTSDTINEPNEIEAVINDDDFTIKRLFLNAGGISIIIDYLGYVDIADRSNFYAVNKTIINEMLKVGLDDASL